MTTAKNHDGVILEGGKPFRVITVRWPRESNVPTIRGQWRRLSDGRIEATYTRDELQKCFELAEILPTVK